MSRREWVQAILTSMMPARLVAASNGMSRQAYTLVNRSMDFRVLVDRGKVISRTLTSKLADEVVDLPAEDFALELDGGEAVTSSQFEGQGGWRGAERIPIKYPGAADKLSDVEVQGLRNLAGKSRVARLPGCRR